MNAYKITLLLILMFSSYLVSGQKRPVPIITSLYNESTAIPFTGFITIPIHPGVQLGTEYNYIDNESSRLFQTANLSWFYHNYLAQGIGLSTELGYEHRMKSGLSFAGLLGLGYMHTFSTAKEFAYSNGSYKERTDRGNPRLFPSMSVEMGCYLKPEIRNSPKIFLRYQSWVEYPYSPDFIPAMTHINLHAGFKFFIHSNQE